MSAHFLMGRAKLSRSAAIVKIFCLLARKSGERVSKDAQPTIPAPTVSFVSSSTRMNAPVARRRP
jgi:hypothetical protein